MEEQQEENSLPLETAIHRRVNDARAGRDNTVLGRCASGWAVFGHQQFVQGYLLLLPDPVVPDLNALTPERRSQFLLDMSRLGDALLRTTSPLRINYAIFGNLEPALHAHVIPRYRNEPENMRTQQPWAYDWNAAPAFDADRRRAADQGAARGARATRRAAHALMAVQPQFLAYILEQLAGLGRLRSRRMFGGVGLYSGELFFGLIDDDTVFFKTDDTNSADYTARNMPRFMPFPDRPEAVMAYYQVPADIIEDAELLVAWARKSVAVALTSHARRMRARRGRR